MIERNVWKLNTFKDNIHSFIELFILKVVELENIIWYFVLLLQMFTFMLFVNCRTPVTEFIIMTLKTLVWTNYKVVLVREAL